MHISKSLPIFFLLLISCSNEKPDCSACEKKLETLLTNMITPLDLPEVEEPDLNKPKQDQITAIILKNNKYMFEEDKTEYAFEEYFVALEEKMIESDFTIKKIKVAGHKNADYEAVFKIIAFCQANELDPVLAYNE